MPELQDVLTQVELLKNLLPGVGKGLSANAAQTKVLEKYMLDACAAQDAYNKALKTGIGDLALLAK